MFFLASYGTILSDYQKAMPQQFKIVTQEGAVRLFNDSTGGTSVKDSTKRVTVGYKQSIKLQ